VVIAATATGAVTSNRRFCDQIRDAAEDAASDVAEGFARFYPREFARFLDFALSSLSEVRTRAEHGHSRGYFSDEVVADLVRRWAIADRSMRNFRRYLWSVKPDHVPNNASRKNKTAKQPRQGRP
jgi:four helix bundle protein